jgi:two-component sensor histidine kinase
LGVVRRIGDQTLRSSKDLSDFGPKFRQRISALARVQTLVSRLDEDERVTFDHLIESELSALGDHHEYLDKVTLEGPAGVALPSSAVQILALAIHELCTNALKYGALRQAHGRLSIAWKIKEDDPQWLHVDWRETGIEIRPDAMSRVRGSGRDLIEHALPYQLKAKTSFTIEPDGIHCTILVPISEETLRGCDYD